MFQIPYFGMLKNLDSQDHQCLKLTVSKIKQIIATVNNFENLSYSKQKTILIMKLFKFFCTYQYD